MCLCVGQGSFCLAAGEMELRFMRIGVDSESFRDSDRMRMQAVFQDKRCLVFGISISGETEGVRYLFREAHKRGAKTVMITAQNKDSYAEQAKPKKKVSMIIHCGRWKRERRIAVECLSRNQMNKK